MESAATKKMMALERRNQKVVSFEERQRKVKERREREIVKRNVEEESWILLGLFMKVGFSKCRRSSIFGVSGRQFGRKAEGSF